MINLLIIGCTLIVIRAKNPVHSLFSLILVFLNTAILLIQSGIEYIGIFIIIVYIGAIAILFLFVIMMLNMKLLLHQAQKQGGLNFENTLRYLPMLFFITLLFYQFLHWQKAEGDFQYFFDNPLAFLNYFDLISQSEQSIVVIGKVLYTHQFFYFLLCGIVLLLGMYGAIILTFSPVKSIHLQNIYQQNSRLLNNNKFHYEPFSS
jgi:NADH-quinone oxidoreductase subunit J|uniref:NADH-ubiquinone oxidoreductase chain 6 n=1 Tax=Nuclearia simplex TaxID=154970 RepID=M1K4V4_9EUKA|nr:NADH dehydrogenase subunit 6 [Nuclearia simplex]AGE93664.1 NADH dehydrogenase subunit 6 [Nuclearia simplex]